MSHHCVVPMREAVIADRRQSGFVNPMRIHKSLTADIEKRALVWMAWRTPAAINSDHLTGLGFVSQLLAGASYALASQGAWALLLASFFIVLNWLGDSLDGTLARVRDRQRPRYGFYVDHIADTFGALALMLGLAFSGYVHWQIAAGMLVCFYLLSIESFLTTYTMGHFHLSQGIFGPTEIRILLILGNAVLLVNPYADIFGHRVLVFDIGGAVAIVGMGYMAMAAAIRHTAVLYREEKLDDC